MTMSEVSRIQETQNEQSSKDASQAFRQELPFNCLPPPNPEHKSDAPQTPQDFRTADLVSSLNQPGADWGRLMDKLRYTFIDERNDNGVCGMKELACRVSQGTGFGLSIDHFRSSSRVYALYITDPCGYRRTEIPLTGHGSSYDDFPYPTV
jgi:hypothetical protein